MDLGIDVGGKSGWWGGRCEMGGAPTLEGRGACLAQLVGIHTVPHHLRQVMRVFGSIDADVLSLIGVWRDPWALEVRRVGESRCLIRQVGIHTGPRYLR